MASPTMALDVESGKSAASANAVSTPALLSAMLRTSSKISDLFFSPGRAPTVEVNGRLAAVKISGQPALTPDDTRRIAAEIIGSNKHAPKPTTTRRQFITIPPSRGGLRFRCPEHPE